MAKFLFNNTIKPFNVININNFIRPLSTEVAVDINKPVQYPECFDPSPKGKQTYENILFSRKLKALPTSVEKHLFNTTKESPFFTVRLANKNPNILTFYQQLTNTNRLKFQPSFYENIEEDVLENLKAIFIEGAKTLKFTQAKDNNYIDEYTKSSTCLNFLWEESLFQLRNCEHSKSIQIIRNSRNEAFWHNKEYQLPTGKPSQDKNPSFHFQSLKHSNIFQATYSCPLKPESIDSLKLDPSEVIVNQQYSNPNTLGSGYIKFQPSSVPGFWPTEKPVFPILNIESLNFLQTIKNNVFRMSDDYATAAGIMKAFQWGVALSHNNGFSQFNELTYPLVVPTILTDGQTWHFFLYQLNRLCLHSDFYDSNKSANVCWESGPMKLFENEEELKQGKINQDVVKLWYKFLTRELMDTKNIDLNPYIGEDTRTEEKQIEDIIALKEVYLRRPINYKKVEIPMWRKLYKNKFNKLVAPNPWINDYDHLNVK